MHGAREIVKANAHWVPPFGKYGAHHHLTFLNRAILIFCLRGALYLRPIIFGSGAALGVAPSPSYTFVIYASPVGNYFKGGLRGINLIASEDVHR